MVQLTPEKKGSAASQVFPAGWYVANILFFSSPLFSRPRMPSLLSLVSASMIWNLLGSLGHFPTHITVFCLFPRNNFTELLLILNSWLSCGLAYYLIPWYLVYLISGYLGTRMPCYLGGGGHCQAGPTCLELETFDETAMPSEISDICDTQNTALCKDSQIGA